MAKLLSKRGSGSGDLRNGGGHRRRRRVRSAVRIDRGDATELEKEATKMAEPTETDQLQAIRDLLREGRTTEADKQLNDIQEKIRQEAERIKRETPPPG